MLKETNETYLRLSYVSEGEGFRQKLDLVSKMDPDNDYLGESRGVSIVIDSRSAMLIPLGTVIDYVDRNGTKGFKVNNADRRDPPPDTSITLVEARRGFKTALIRRESDKAPPPKPPAELFRIVHYEAPLGKFAAYLTPEPKDSKKHPTIIWIAGGDCNSIGSGCWHEGKPQNDQSAAAYRKVGLVMMFPALRGGNGNAGIKEGFLGEVDDVIAAAEFLSKQDYVDPKRIYLGGHSTGGTLAMLVAECSDRFRAVISFGPVNDLFGYGLKYNPFSITERKEMFLRSPGRWLHTIKVPTFVIEGEDGNSGALESMALTSKNPNIQFFNVKGANHFNILAPTNRLLAEKILKDDGPKLNLTLTKEELEKPFRK
jgi:Fe-S cluster assembly iron-binding protein IscA/alpha/beta superfamily hydrolase